MPDVRAFFGPHDLNLGWVPSFRYLLRRARVRLLLKELAPGKLLEVGCGSGALLIELSHMGFSCVGLETSDPARALAQRLIDSYAAPVVLHAAPQAEDWRSRFDLVMALDVLEHIADDVSALTQWSQWLRPDGKLLLSVPAHRSRWSAGDEWAGHYRRYDRDELLALLGRVGYRVEKLECYGFPFANLTEWLGAFYYRYALGRRQTQTHEQASASSGIERTPYLRTSRLLQSWAGMAVVQLACALQEAFIRTDLGSGYLVLASRPCVA